MSNKHMSKNQSAWRFRHNKAADRIA